jgi:hypothetical protein
VQADLLGALDTMSTVLAQILILLIVASALWIRTEFAASRTPQFRVLVFLVLESREKKDNGYGLVLPNVSRFFRRVVILRVPPTPGMELDGLGTPAVKIARTQLQENAKFDVFIYLEPIPVPEANIEAYSQDLVADCGWESLGFDPR